ncbi:MAG: S8 family serine peptidase, partial [Chitinophagaceae bacterium]|nr:S8 family serine peptidase [Chitinophagaceae bacterium]
MCVTRPGLLWRFLLIGSLLTTCCYAQERSFPIFFKNGQLASTGAVESIDPLSPISNSQQFNGKLFLFLQFQRLPAHAEIFRLRSAGIELLEYIPEHTYLASLSTKVTSGELKQFGIIQSFGIDPLLKMDPALLTKINNAAAGATQKLLVSFYPGIEKTEAAVLLSEMKIIWSNRSMHKEQILIEVETQRIEEIMKLPFVRYIEAEPPPYEALNDESQRTHQSSILHNEAPGIGRGLSGRGVAIGLGDVGSTGAHIDHAYKSFLYVNNAVSHAVHVAGIMAGGGNLNPRLKGHAFRSKLYINILDGIIRSTPEYYSQYGMVITNNSYGLNIRNCDVFGGYTSASYAIDQQMNMLPKVLHVFAAGNDGFTSCLPYPSGYRTIQSGYQASKNVLTVGGTSKDAEVQNFSRGPVIDGRIKPEIVAIGLNVVSTVPPNDYWYNNGTSMAAPQASGVAALMYERFRQLNSNITPDAALIKAVLCNSATDIGVPGPDFAFGFGWLNALHAAETIEKRQYDIAQVDHGEEKKFQLSVQPNTAELKVMLYWPDREASLYTSKTLVNDLDIVVTAPNGQVFQPYVLNGAFNGILLPAVQGIDRLNNIEQVVIRNPVVGTYTVTIKGHVVPFGAQQFYVVQHHQEKKIRIIHPAGGEKLKAGEAQSIIWEDGQVPNGKYKVEYTVDGGAWQSAGSITNPLINRLLWTVPVVTSANVRVRIFNTETTEEVLSQPFVIFPDVNFNLVSTCEGAITMNIVKPPGIDSVAIMKIGKEEMELIGVTDATSYTIKGLTKDSTYWFSACAIKTGKTGERSIAKSILQTAGACNDSVSKDDLKLLSLISPQSGRKHTSTERRQAEKITYVLQSLSPDTIHGPIISSVYLGDIIFATDTITTSIYPLGQLTVTSSKTIDLNVAGKYPLSIKVKLAGDPDSTNNFLSTTIRISSNNPLALPWQQQFNALRDSVYFGQSHFVTDGAEELDLFPGNGGKLIVKKSASKGSLISALAGPVNSVLVYNTMHVTYNLSAYDTSEDIFMSVEIGYPSDAELLTIRGNDSAPWLKVSMLDTIPSQINRNHRNLSRILKANNQNFSSSFQARFVIPAASNLADGNYPLSNIRIYKQPRDIVSGELIPSGARRFSEKTIPIIYRVMNNSGTVASTITLKLRCYNGRIITDTITALAPYASRSKIMQIQTADMVSATLTSTGLQGSLSMDGDTYSANDSSITFIAINKMIDSFPYLERFNSDESYWRGGGLTLFSTNLVEGGLKKNAASGKYFWDVPLVENTPFTSGGLTSPVFDIKGMTNPYVSFSLTRYMRNGRDSAFFDYSLGTASPIQRLVPDVANRTNWFNNVSGRSWTDSNKRYWHVASAKLPQSDSLIQFRIRYLRGRGSIAPMWPYGVGVDDVHVYDLRYPILKAGVSVAGTLQTSEG